jgi:hypothetical protein
MASRRRSGHRRSPLLELSYPIRTLHMLPGRVRFEIPKLQGDSAASDRLVSSLTRLDGVGEVRVTTRIGTVLIRFDDTKLQPELLVAAIVRLLDLEREMETTPQSAAGREIRAAAQALDRAVFDMCRGLIDLRTAVPLLLATLGLYRIVTRQGTVLPAGATLLWWAYTAMRRGAPAARTGGP